MDDLTLAYVLIAAGVVCLLAEMVVPSGGVLSVLAVGCAIVGVILVFVHGTYTQALITLGAVFVGLPVLGLLMFSIWPYTPMGRRLIRSAADEDATISRMPVNLVLEQLRGRYGRVLSPLRPSGTVDFDGRRVDAMSEGMLIEQGQWVRCVDVKAGRVLVREVEKPDLENLTTQDFDFS